MSWVWVELKFLSLSWVDFLKNSYKFLLTFQKKTKIDMKKYNLIGVEIEYQTPS